MLLAEANPAAAAPALLRMGCISAEGKEMLRITREHVMSRPARGHKPTPVTAAVRVTSRAGVHPSIAQLYLTHIPRTCINSVTQSRLQLVCLKLPYIRPRVRAINVSSRIIGRSNSSSSSSSSSSSTRVNLPNPVSHLTLLPRHSQILLLLPPLLSTRRLSSSMKI